MPQFEISTALPQVVWLAISFALLFLLLSAILPKLQKVSDQRVRLVSDDLETAERLKTEAETTHRAYEAGLNEARAKALKLTTDVKDEASRKTAERVRALDQVLEVRGKQAASRIEAAGREALGELDRVAEQAAGDIVERLIGRRPDPARLQAAIAGAGSRGPAGGEHAGA